MRAGFPEGRVVAVAQLVVACSPEWSICDIILSESGDEDTSPGRAFEGRRQEGGEGGVFLARRLVQGNVTFKGARFIKRMGAKPVRT